MSFSERRARIVEHLASALWHVTQEGSPVSALAVKLIEHRMLDALRDNECPTCAEMELTKMLDEAIDGQTQES